MDLWTEDQEIVLLKAIMRWKPAGMHKHFRMMAIREYMLMEGVTGPEEDHTKIPGIWEKLGSLYDLSTLDEREDSIVHETNEDDDDDPSEYYISFTLPADEYGEQMFDRRLKPDGTDSPAMQFSRAESTVADTDEPRSSPVSLRGSGRNVRAARRGRGSKLQNEVEHSRRTSKATSTADDETMEDVAEGDNEASDESEDEESEGEDKSRTGNKSGRGRGQKAQPIRTAKRARRR